MSATTTNLDVSPREPSGSRSARRLRREGWVPGVIYGGDAEPVAIQIEVLTLNRTLAHSGAILDLAIGGETDSVLVKDLQRHPVTGAPVHVDFLRVRMDEKIATTIFVELTGGEDAPGAKEGGVLEQVTREINIEALPRDIPDGLTLDVSTMEMNDTLTLSTVTAPNGVTFLDDPEETVLATMTPPRLEVEEEEIETETALVGEDGEPIEAPEGEGEEAGEAPAAEGESDSSDEG
jgi:large subunit ribosomal protein L25